MHALFSARAIRGIVFLALGSGAAAAWLQAEEAKVIDGRLAETAKLLSSDEYEGRGIGTKGLDQAAEYLSKQFAQAGLKTALFGGAPFQNFTMTTGAELGPKNSLTFVGPGKESAQPTKIELKQGQSYTPMALGGSGKFDLPLVFVGYGITAKDEKYDDYEGIDVKDKAVVVLRHEPQQNNPHSVFEGTSNSQYAPFNRKISNAYEHGAVCVIFVNDEFDIKKNLASLEKTNQTAADEIAAENKAFKAIEKPSAEEQKKHDDKINKLSGDIKAIDKKLVAAKDPILAFNQAGPESSGRNIPVLFCRRAELDEVVKAALNKDLATLEKEIDKDLKPQSAELKGWKAEGEASITRKEANVKNVVAVLEGEGPLAEETIIIGAHYDHLGSGGSGSLAPGSKEIHNGADDNGSGTTVLVEVARTLAARSEKLPRRIVFIAFTGEEEGLIGSARYTKNPLFPLENTVAMLNMDMVGRLKDEKLIVHGTGTAPELDVLVDKYGKELGFTITKKPGGFGPSDHSSFYAKKIPVLHFFTGNHADYHRPSDDFDKLNIDGMRRVATMVEDIAVDLAKAEKRPTFVETKAPANPGGGGDRPYFGSIPDFSQDEPGYALTGVTKDGPAEKAGLKAGDIIIQLGESKIGGLEDFDSALRKFKGGDKVPVVVKRGKEQVKVEVTLGAPR